MMCYTHDNPVFGIDHNQVIIITYNTTVYMKYINMQIRY